MADKLRNYFDTPGQDNPYGGLLPNSAIPDPTYIDNGNVTTWVNNKNWEGSMTNEVWAELSLEMIRQTEFKHLKFVSGNAIIAPRRAGTARISYNRLRPLSVVISPLREGELPPKLTGGSEKASATYSQFAAYMQITDVEYQQNPDELFLRYGQDLMRSANETFDIITREFLYMGASYAYANGCIDIDAVAQKGVNFKSPSAGEDIWKYKGQRGAQLTFSDIREQQKLMKLFKVKPHPRNGTYIVLVGPDGIDQLRNDQEYKSWNYATDAEMYDNNNYVMVSTDIAIYEIENSKRVKTTDGLKEVGVAFILGGDCFREVKLEGSGIQLISKDFGSAGTSDPVNQTATMAWKHSGWGLAIIRSEAIIALHYALGGDASTTFGTTITWTKDGGNIIHNAPYGFTRLTDGSNFFLNLDDIYNGKVINPKPYPTDQGTFVKNQPTTSTSKLDAMSRYYNPAMQEALGTLVDLIPALKDVIKNADLPLNVTNALNATYSENSAVELNTVLTVTTLGEIGSGGNVQPTDPEIKVALVAKNASLQSSFVTISNRTKFGADIVGNTIYKGTVPVTFTTKKDELSTIIKVTALGAFKGVGNTPTGAEIEAQVQIKNAQYTPGSATFTNPAPTATAATATAVPTGNYKGTVALTYVYTKA